MSNTLLEEIKSNRLSALSVFGSVASIVALAMVLLDAMASGQIAPALIGWRIIFFIISLFTITAASLFTYYWTKVAYANVGQSKHGKIYAATWRGVVGFLCIGVAFDALFAAIYWQPWMLSFIDLLVILGLLTAEV